MSATSARVPLDEYLFTVYDPDCEYVDGELAARFGAVKNIWVIAPR